MLIEIALSDEYVAEVVWTVKKLRFFRFFAPVQKVPLQAVLRHPMVRV